MTCRLKKNKPPFEVVDGPMTGRKYTHGVEYTEVPADMKNYFTVSGSGTTTIVCETKTTMATNVRGGHKK